MKHVARFMTTLALAVVSTFLLYGQDTTSFYDNFDAGNTEGWTWSTGDWHFNAGMVTTNFQSGHHLMMQPNHMFSDFTYQADVMKDTNDSYQEHPGLVFRSKSAISNYVFRINGYGSQSWIQLLRNLDNSDQHTGIVATAPWFTDDNNHRMYRGVWYTMKVQAAGPYIRCKIWRRADLEPPVWNLEVIDTMNSDGTVGLEYYNGGHEFDNVVVVGTGTSPGFLPTPVLSYPPDNIITNDPLIHLAWNPIGFGNLFPDVRYELQVSAGYTFNPDSLVIDSPPMITTDTTINVSSRKNWYSWRIRAASDSIVSNWSVVRRFRYREFTRVTIADIQSVPPDSLLLADSLMPDIPAIRKLQSSSYENDSVTTTVVCVVPPGGLTPASAFLACDTGSAAGRWHGMMMSFPASAFPHGLPVISRGDILRIDGVVSETPPTQANTITSLSVLTLSVVGHSFVIPEPALVLADTLSRGSLPRFSTGEGYEGCMVNIPGCTVTADRRGTSSETVIRSASDDSIGVLDISSWFTLGQHRNSASPYSTLIPGAVIDTIRGFVHVDGNSGYAVAPVLPGDIRFASPTRGVIRGSIYYDININNVLDYGEPGCQAWPISLTGPTGSTSALTRPDGSFSFNGLPAGTYRITVTPALYYFPGTFPESVTIGQDDTVSSLLIPYYSSSQNTVSGYVFEDLDENGILDTSEHGISGIRVCLTGYPVDTVVTDSMGHYLFRRVQVGLYNISLVNNDGWELIAPNYPPEFPLYFNNYYQHASGYNFSLRRPPTDRVKTEITFTDNIHTGTRTIAFGSRPRATKNIYGVNASASVIDFSEGEFEIPPASGGFFDVRFLGPTDLFGAGSWIDIRPPGEPSAIDTFIVAFCPGYFEGGNYPVTFTWDHIAVGQHYLGPVKLKDAGGNEIDMKTSYQYSINDPKIYWLRIMAQGPVAAPHNVANWWMVSFPGRPPAGQEDRYYTSLFPLAASNAFRYSSGKYHAADTLEPGKGYWLRCAGIADSSYRSLLSMQYADTTLLEKGWNMVGSPGLPVVLRADGAVQTDPPGLITSRFFGYQKGYSAADTLLPFRSYWVKTSDAGRLMLTAGTAVMSAGMARHTAAAGPREADILRKSVLMLEVTDAAGAKQGLRICSGLSHAESEWSALPPPPPAGGFDARFTGAGSAWNSDGRPVTVDIRSGAYPVTVTWHRTDTAIHGAFIIRDGNGPADEYPLEGVTGRFIIDNERQVLRFEPAGLRDGDLPVITGLMQNYPDPFNPVTSIRYHLADDAKVVLTVYNLLGQAVATLVDAPQHRGTYTVRWDGRGFSSGVYYYRLDAAPAGRPGQIFSDVKKMMMIR